MSFKAFFEDETNKDVYQDVNQQKVEFDKVPYKKVDINKSLMVLSIDNNQNSQTSEFQKLNFAISFDKWKTLIQKLDIKHLYYGGRIQSLDLERMVENIINDVGSTELSGKTVNDLLGFEGADVVINKLKLLSKHAGSDDILCILVSDIV